MENLLIDVLRAKYPLTQSGNIEVYYEPDRQRYKDFSKLIEIIDERSSEFNEAEMTVKRFVSKVEPFRETANATAHTLSVIPDAVETLKHDIQHILDFYASS